MLGAAVDGAPEGAVPGLTAGLAPPWPALRQELQLHPAGTNRDGSPAWHVADPVRNLFFRIGWLEFEMLKRWHLQGAAAIAQDIAAHTTLAAQAEDVESFTAFLRQHQLLVERGQAPRAPRRGWRWLLDNYLFIRIPLVRPAPLLRRMLPWVGWLFSWGFVALTVLAGVVGLVLASRQWDVVRANLAGALTWGWPSWCCGPCPIPTPARAGSWWIRGIDSGSHRPASPANWRWPPGARCCGRWRRTARCATPSSSWPPPPGC
ncbi:hypothetical protein [Variovorax rhizosphaerae]|uniref:Uncharacterized protein n=1 Tax=Variovorax rhizosphaerae TaxID=1836200 RepID=A0ABU8WEI7_9BURK